MACRSCACAHLSANIIARVKAGEILFMLQFRAVYGSTIITYPGIMVAALPSLSATGLFAPNDDVLAGGLSKRSLHARGPAGRSLPALVSTQFCLGTQGDHEAASA